MVLIRDPEFVERLLFHFHQGIPYTRLSTQLEFEGFGRVSVSWLKKIISRLDLTRRQSVLDPRQLQFVHDRAESIIRAGLATSNYGLGYRRWYQRLKTIYHLPVSRAMVWSILRRLDPVGTANRRRSRLVRRVYVGHGPDFVWHMDGNDKLKSYGISLHGCIDGYSRKVLWLRACHSNKNPAIVGRYFLDCVVKNGCCPRFMRTDRGVENIRAGVFTDELSANGRHLFGRSVHNQRIEQFWSTIITRITNWSGHFDCLLGMSPAGPMADSEGLVNLIQYCFLALVDADFVEHAMVHNFSTIPYNGRSGTTVPGKPYYLYRGAVDSYGTSLAQIDLDVIQDMYLDTMSSRRCSSEAWFAQFEQARVGLGLDWPGTITEANTLFYWIRSILGM